MSDSVVIVGGGLSGLRVAQLLHEQGLPFRLLEARHRLGGRILSLPADAVSAPSARYDLGPAWFWPDFQPRICALAKSLGVHAFPQYATGATAMEHSPHEPVRYGHGFSSGSSMRFAGGAMTLIEAVAARLPAEQLTLGAKVVAIKAEGGHVEIVAEIGGERSLVQGAAVILAMPPRLAGYSIRFTPELPVDVGERWSRTATWMAGQAKVVAVYDKAFWRENGLSGDGQSRVGPMVEIHDACAADGSAALFGFVGVDAANRAAAGEQLLMEASVQQLTRLFGARAASPKKVLVVDWAQDPFTSTPADAGPVERHPDYGHSDQLGQVWRKRLICAGSEAAPENGGYLEGALEAAENAVAAYLKL